jgi:hypothetical protein
VARSLAYVCEALEQRVLLAVDIDLGIPMNNLDKLRFSGDFVLDSHGSYESTSYAVIGFTPKPAEAFKPLLRITGTIDVPGPTLDQSKFSFLGALSYIGAGGAYTEVYDSPSGSQQFSQIAIGDLAGAAGVDLTTSAFAPGIQSFSVAGVGFKPSKLLVNNPGAAQGTTVDARVGYQGRVDFSALKLTGLSIGVSGSNFVYTDSDKGTTLTGVDASFSSNFTSGGVTFTGTLGAGYTLATNTFTIFGGASFKTIDGGMNQVAATLGSSGDAGLIIGNGTIDRFSLGFTGEFDIWGLTIEPDDLTFSYDTGEDQFEMWGKLTVKTSGTTLTASMGSESNPGLMANDGGIQQINMGLSGSFSLFSLGIQVPAGNPVTLVYHSTDSQYLISGTVIVPAVYNAKVSLGTFDQPGLVITNGSFSVNNFKLALSDIQLGAFTLKTVQVAYSQTSSATTYIVTLQVKFPGDWEVGGTIAIVNDEIDTISLNWRADSEESRIPIGESGLFLSEMDGTVENLDQPSKILVSGHMEAEYGKSVSIFGTSCVIFRAEGSFEADENHLSIDANVWLGAYGQSGKTNAVLGSGSGHVLLDWNDELYEASMHASLLDGAYQIDASFMFNGVYDDIWIAASASLHVPNGVPLIGGAEFASGEFRFSYFPQDMSKSYVAAWVNVNLLVTHVDAGFKYNFDKKSWKFIGNSDVNGLKNPPVLKDQITVYSSKFTAPAGSNAVTFSVEYPQNSGKQELSIIKPGGQEIKQADFASNGITLLTNQNTSTSLNCLIGDPNSTTLLPAGDYTVKLNSTNYEFPNQTVNVGSILNDGNGQAKITLEVMAKGIKPGDTVTISGNSLAAYNTDHIVQSVSPDGTTLVTDQLYVGQGAGGAAGGWQQPKFTGTFSSLAPQVSLGSVPLLPNSPILNVPVSGSVSPAFAQASTVDLYLDTDNSGYDGRILERGVPLTIDSGGKITATAQGLIGDLPSGDYYAYAVISDGTNTPKFSNYTTAFHPQRAVSGTVVNQYNTPQSGWQVYADLNRDGIRQDSEPLSQATNSDGQYQISDDEIRSDLPTVTNIFSENGYTSVTFASIHNMNVGDRFVISGSPVQSLNKVYVVTAVPLSTKVVTNVAAGASSTIGAASLLYAAVPTSAPFDLRLVNPFIGPDGQPTDFVFGSDNGVLSGVTSGDSTANFSVKEKSVISGNIFNDVNHDQAISGQPRQFDFGTPSSPVQSGYTQMTPSTTYSSSRGYGWLTSGISAEDRGGGTDLTRDFNFAPRGTFAVDLPNGTYVVTLILGDLGPNDHDDVGIFLQSNQVDTVSTVSGQVVTKTYSHIAITNKQLQFELRDLGGTDPNGVVEALTVVREDDPGLSSWGVQLKDSSGQDIATTQSGANGDYRFGQLAPGTYNVSLVPPSGAEAFYTFDGTVNKNVPDVSGSLGHHDGTLDLSSNVNTAANFGISDHPHAEPGNKIFGGGTIPMEVPYSASLSGGAGGLSFGAWFRSDRGGDGIGLLNSSSAATWFFDIQSSGSGFVQSIILTDNTHHQISAQGTATLVPDNWYYLAWTYDGTTNDDAVKFYVNGLPAGTAAGTLPSGHDLTPTDQQSLLSFGGFYSYVDDIGFWDKALSPSEVYALSEGVFSPSYQQVLPSSGGSYTITVGNDFDVHTNTNFGVEQFKLVSGTVTGHDMGANGVLLPDSQVKSGWNVNLIDDTGKIIASATSGSDGTYVFPKVPTGEFTLRETPPAGWRQTSPFVSNPSFASPWFEDLHLGGVASAFAVADFDRDGFTDVAVAYNNSQVRVWWGTGSSTGEPFSSPTTFNGGTSSDIAKLLTLDFRGTGRKDLIVIDTHGNGYLLQNTGSSSRSTLFSAQSGAAWTLGASTLQGGFAVGDFTKDGKDDVAITYTNNGTAQTVVIFGPGTSRQFIPGLTGTDLAAADINGDGDLDLIAIASPKIIVAYDFGSGNFPHLDTIPASGTFEDMRSNSKLSIADINRDGRLDIAFSGTFSNQNTLEVVTQDANGQFGADPGDYFAVFTGATGTTAAQVLKDFDGDLRPDLLMAPAPDNNVHPQAAYFGSGDLGSSPWFQDSVALPLAINPAPNVVVSVSDLIAVDTNNDGMLDFLSLDLVNGNFSLTRNTAQPNATGINVFVDADVDQLINENFDNAQTSPIYGKVFADDDFDGVRDPGEATRPTVRVYLDRNNNYTFDPGEPSTLTDANGSYAFNDLPAGSYEIRIVPPAGLMASGGSHRLSVLNGLPQAQRSYDIGLVPALIDPLPPLFLHKKDHESLLVGRTEFGAQRPLRFTLLPGAPSVASIDPTSGLLTWKPKKPMKKGVYDIFVQVEDLLRPGIVQVERLTITIYSGKLKKKHCKFVPKHNNRPRSHQHRPGVFGHVPGERNGMNRHGDKAQSAGCGEKCART